MMTTFDTWNNNVIEKLEIYCHDILNDGIFILYILQNLPEIRTKFL